MDVGRKRSFLLTPDDVHDIFMIPRNPGSEVVCYSRIENFTRLDKLNEEYGLSSLDKLSSLGNLFKVYLKDGRDDFKHMFVYYAI